LKKIAIFWSASLLAILVAASASAQVWRGNGRMQGVVRDQSGKAIPGAKITVVLPKVGNVGPETITADKNGRWAAGGLMGGTWNIDIQAEGFQPKSGTAQVSEINTLSAPIITVLEPKPVEEAKPAAAEETREAIVVGGVEISPETAASLEAANNFMKQQKWAEAAVEYEKAVAVLTTNTQLKAALARAYYGAGDIKKAIGSLTEVYNADSGNVTYATLLADMLLENQQYDAGKKILAAIPAGGISDAGTLINLGIRFINMNKVDDAYTYFNNAVTVAADSPAAYYYRGIAELQQKKMKEAKADFQKVVSIAPDSSEAKDAKDLLAQLK
jgi:hypothetical protein